MEDSDACTYTIIYLIGCIGCIENQKMFLMSMKVHLCSSLGKYFILQTQAKELQIYLHTAIFLYFTFMSALCGDITEVALICREKKQANVLTTRKQ